MIVANVAIVEDVPTVVNDRPARVLHGLQVDGEGRKTDGNVLKVALTQRRQRVPHHHEIRAQLPGHRRALTELRDHVQIRDISSRETLHDLSDRASRREHEVRTN